MKNLISSYLTLFKFKVVFLIMATAWVGMLLAGLNSEFDIVKFLLGSLGIFLCSSSAASFNQIIDIKVDKIMSRTNHRPIVIGDISIKHALIAGSLVGFVGLFVLFEFVNSLTTVMTFVTMFGYALIYTAYLKYWTPQNIVIGGITGAMPPLLGWIAITNEFSYRALLLVLIIFIWTPPHFWALALHRKNDYASAKIPMLPNTHGEKFTSLNILLYAYLLFAVCLLPYAVKMSGEIYLIGALTLNFVSIIKAHKIYNFTLKNQNKKNNPIYYNYFKFSIIFLYLIFIFISLDNFIFRTQ